jgi:peptidoglycan-N-acetylglucosamine deacetylase
VGHPLLFCLAAVKEENLFMRSTSFVVRVWGFAAITFLISVFAAAADHPARWPNGKKAAIVLTYDDSLRSQLDIAIPQLNEAGFKGTFFLNGTFALEDLSRWRAVAAAGHELGNHSVFHPCPAAAFASDAQFHTENYSVRGMLREISAMNTFLLAVDGKSNRTYGVPCSQTMVGGPGSLCPDRGRRRRSDRRSE